MPDHTQRAAAPARPQVRYSEAGVAAFQLLQELDRSAALFDNAVSRGRLALLRVLATAGPMTMSDAARARHSSRQAVQRLTGALVEQGLVQLTPNPQHRRAPLLQLSAAGVAAWQALAQQEATRLNALARGLDAAEIRSVTRVLKALRQRSGGGGAGQRVRD